MDLRTSGARSEAKRCFSELVPLSFGGIVFGSMNFHPRDTMENPFRPVTHVSTTKTGLGFQAPLQNFGCESLSPKKEERGFLRMLARPKTRSARPLFMVERKGLE